MFKKLTIAKVITSVFIKIILKKLHLRRDKSYFIGDEMLELIIS